MTSHNQENDLNYKLPAHLTSSGVYALCQPGKYQEAAMKFLLEKLGNKIKSISNTGKFYTHPHGIARLLLSREHWNHGYATQALGAVIDAAFSSLPLNRLEAQHDVRNPASGRVMEKCGLRQEGILRDRIVNKGEYVDAALYAILRADWENVQR